MRVGVAKEIKSQEYRVALTPAGARELVQRGHEVLVEESAGVGSAFPDEAYERAGASIVSVDDVWTGSDLLLKVKEPIALEYPRLREGLTLFTYLHIAADEPLTRALVESGIAAIAYETVETDRGALPLLAPMSEIAGRLAPQAGADNLEKPKGGRGILLGGVAGVAPARVLVVGGGMVGYNAAVIALGMGAQVTILERSVERMRFLEQILSGRVQLLMSSSLQIEESIQEADLTIGAVLIPGALAPKLVTREMLGAMKESSVFVDVAIDQGGCAETSKATTHDDPVYTVDGVIHYCVANMPGAVPITSTRALTNVTLPYVEQLADLGPAAAIAANPELARGVNALGGKLTYQAVAEAHDMDFTPLATRSAPASPERFARYVAARFERRKRLPELSPPGGVSGAPGFFGLRSVGKILITANVIAAARPTIATMYTTRRASPRHPVQSRRRIAACRGRASSCSTPSALASCRMQGSTGTKARAPSATSPAPSGVSTCPTWRLSAWGT